MNIALILPIYNQLKNLNRVLTSIEHQTVKPTCVYLVVDRPEEDDEFKNYDCTIEYIKNTIDYIVKLHHDIIIHTIIMSNLTLEHKLSGFMAGKMRNIGIDAALADKTNAFDMFVFCDGDCILQNDCIRGHLSACAKHIPVLSIGRRLEAQYRWNDKREFDSSMIHLNLFNKNGCIINNPILLEKCLIVWSCNIALNLFAIKLIKEFNFIYYNQNELFNRVFDKKWGGEDGFLGISAWQCRIFIVMIGMIKSGVQHINHERPTDKYSIEHKMTFDTQCNILRKKISANPIPLSFFDNYSL